MSDAQLVHLEERLAALEATHAIQQLKSDYLAACDAKNPQAMRACFADGEVAIDYGVVGSFNNADDLVKLYTKAACHPHMVEMHHASNPRIQVLNTTQAKAQWALAYRLINTQENTLTELGGEYEDEYSCIEGEWKISATKFIATSTLVLSLNEDEIRKVFAGGPAG